MWILKIQVAKIMMKEIQHGTLLKLNIIVNVFQKALNTHLSPQIRENLYSCNEKSKNFYQNSKLEIHLKTQTEMKKYSCNQCGKIFTGSSTLKTHNIAHRSEKKIM